MSDEARQADTPPSGASFKRSLTKFVEHPEYGRVRPIASRHRHAKTWKHLHNPREHWWAILGLEPDVLAGEARKWGAPEWGAGLEPPQCLHRLLRQHHNRLYGPAYQAVVANSETVWADHADTFGRLIGLDSRGIIIVLAGGSQSRCVVTAFRPNRAHRPVGVDQMAQYAHRYFERHARSDHMNRWLDAIEADLCSLAGEPINDADAAHRLGVAYGYGLTLRTQRLNDAVDSVRPRWAAARKRFGAELHPAVELRALVDHVGPQVEPYIDLESLFALLDEAEEAVVLGEALGLTEDAELAGRAFMRRLAQGPAELCMELRELISTRRASARPGTGMHRFWTGLGDALMARAPTGWSAVLQRLRSAAGPLAEWLETATAVPAAVLSSEPCAELNLGRAPETAGLFTVFIVDNDYPEGCLIHEPHGRVWNMEHPDVLVVAIGHPEGQGPHSLTEALTQVDGNSGWTVNARAISRPSSQRT